MRDTGIRIRIENLNWETRVIFVPDRKTEERRRRMPMSNRVFNVLKQRSAKGAKDGFPSKRVESAHFTTMVRDFGKTGVKAGLPEDLVLYCGRHNYGTRILKRTGILGYGHENHGPQGREDRHAVSASRARDRACSARSGHTAVQTGTAGLRYDTLYGTPKTSTPVSD
jgi:integrase